jgi:precorrin-3B synthase
VVRVLAPMGLVFDADSSWAQVTACAGRPGCGSALADVRADAADAVAHGTLPTHGRQHWVGCHRACGRPRDAALIEATPQGYQVTTAGQP